ncbi:MAG: hypothetical protein AMS22_03245 [Thiotrichales bacterium SG8_50]|nr:MAG: hypothetical protein AMS22_03245 [Thiotrichales bacterium SG8_50]
MRRSAGRGNRLKPAIRQRALSANQGLVLREKRAPPIQSRALASAHPARTVAASHASGRAATARAAVTWRRYRRKARTLLRGTACQPLPGESARSAKPARVLPVGGFAEPRDWVTADRSTANLL